MNKGLNKNIISIIADKKCAISVSIVMLVFSFQTGLAQLPSFGAQYFQQQSLANPAMAGIDSGLTVYLGHNQQTSDIKGAPNAQTIMATYNLGQIAFGINVYNSKYGLFKNTTAAASITYSQPVGDENQQLHFGISFGGTDSRIDMSNIDGDVDDPVVHDFNNQGIQFDGDVGLSYTGKGLTLQAVLPRFSTAFNNNEKDFGGQTKLFTAASYAFNMEEAGGMGIEPKLCYRMMNGFEDIIDVGARLSFMDNKLDIQGMYHSTSNVTVGFGVTVLSDFSLLFLYSSEPSDLRAYTKGNVEFGLKANF